MLTPKVTPVDSARLQRLDEMFEIVNPSVGGGEMIAAAADPSLDTLQGEELLLGVNQYS